MRRGKIGGVKISEKVGRKRNE